MRALIMAFLQRIRKTVLLRCFWGDPDPDMPDSLQPEERALLENHNDSHEGLEAPGPGRTDSTLEVIQVNPANPYGRYISFPQEDEQDYTDGPARIVDAFDGVKECGALLMTFDLSKKIQNMLYIEDKYFKERQRSEQELKAIHRLGREVNNEISSHNARLAIRKAEASVEVEDEEICRLQYELNMLKLLKDDMSVEENIVNTNLESNADLLLQAQLEVSGLLRDAFVYAQLFKPETRTPELPMQDFDLQTEYARVCEEYDEANGLPKPRRPLDTDKAYMYATPAELTAEEEAREEAQDQLYHAQQRLAKARDQFENREEERRWAKEVHLAERLDQEDLTDASMEAFDLKWLGKFQEYTHELIAAEQALSQAKVEAAEAGVLGVPKREHATPDAKVENASCPSSWQEHPGSAKDQVSGISRDVEVDGRSESGTDLSVEAEDPVLAVPKIQRWLGTIPEEADADEHGMVDVDDFELEEVEFGDSISAILGSGQRPSDIVDLGKAWLEGNHRRGG